MIREVKMKRNLLFLIILLLIFYNLSSDEVNKNEQYFLQKGDKITIEVLDHKQLSKTLTILPDGTIEYPILGNMKIEGLTPSELSEIIKKHLTSYITMPVVSVYVRSIYGNKINVIGYVNRAGSFQIYKPVDIPTALSFAYGIKNIRKVKYIKILRKDGTLITVKLSTLWKNNKDKKVENKLLLFPGDTVIVPPPKEFNWAMLSSITAALGLIVSVYTVFTR